MFLCLTFFLDEKSNKKIKTVHASLEKLALEKRKFSKLLPSVVKQGVFFRFSLLFFGSPCKVGRSRDFENFTGFLRIIL
jgi:hypothetical protein